MVNLQQYTLPGCRYVYFQDYAVSSQLPSVISPSSILPCFLSPSMCVHACAVNRDHDADISQGCTYSLVLESTVKISCVSTDLSVHIFSH